MTEGAVDDYVKPSSLAPVRTGTSPMGRMASDPPLRGERDSVSQALEAAGRQFCDHEAYVDGPEPFTFGEWLVRSRGVAANLTAAGARHDIDRTRS